jgi:hypothetical protein
MSNNRCNYMISCQSSVIPGSVITESAVPVRIAKIKSSTWVMHKPVWMELSG